MAVFMVCVGVGGSRLEVVVFFPSTAHLGMFQRMSAECSFCERQRPTVALLATRGLKKYCPVEVGASRWKGCSS